MATEDEGVYALTIENEEYWLPVRDETARTASEEALETANNALSLLEGFQETLDETVEGIETSLNETLEDVDDKLDEIRFSPGDTWAPGNFYIACAVASSNTSVRGCYPVNLASDVSSVSINFTGTGALFVYGIGGSDDYTSFTDADDITLSIVNGRFIYVICTVSGFTARTPCMLVTNSGVSFTFS